MMRLRPSLFKSHGPLVHGVRSLQHHRWTERN